VDRSIHRARGVGVIGELSVRKVLATAVQWAFCLFVIYALWQWVLYPHWGRVEFASPSHVWTQLRTYADDGALWSMVRITLSESGVGFVLGSALGVLVALGIGALPVRLGKVFEPVVGGLYAMPKFVLAPILLIWLGTAFRPRVFLITLAVFPLVAIYCLTGIRTVDPDMVTMMRLSGASKAQITRKLMLPHISGYVTMSLVIAAPHALTVAIGSEILFGSSTGIGGVLYTASDQFNPAGVLAALVVGTVMAVFLLGVARLVERSFLQARGQGGGTTTVVTL
jgi:NitT/TauT family transport system permease protein